MNLNELGNIANNFWIEIPEHFPMIEMHEHIIMPNHLHGIIEIVGTSHDVKVILLYKFYIFFIIPKF